MQETIKNNINAGNDEGYIHCATLVTCLSWALQALSPFTPFICNELLQHLPQNIALNMQTCHNIELEEEITKILDICQSIRQLKSQHIILRKHEPKVHLFAHSDAALILLSSHLQQIQSLTQMNGVTISLALDPEDKAKSLGKLYTTANYLCSFGM